MPELEWHVMLGATDPDRRLVGCVESVSPEGITLTPLTDSTDEVFIHWDHVVYLMQSGPDRDDVLFAALDQWRGA